MIRQQEGKKSCENGGTGSRHEFKVKFDTSCAEPLGPAVRAVLTRMFEKLCIESSSKGSLKACHFEIPYFLDFIRKAPASNGIRVFSLYRNPVNYTAVRQTNTQGN
jgi:hypothetical protein